MVLFKEANIRVIASIKYDGTIVILETITHLSTPKTDLAGDYSQKLDIIAILTLLNKIDIIKRKDLQYSKTIDVS